MKVRLRTAHGTYLRAGDVRGEINQADKAGPFLYDEPFLLSSRAMAMPEEEYRQALRAHPGNATFLTMGQGYKESIRATPFDPRDQWGLVQDRLKVAISEDKAPIVFVCGPPFWEQQLRKNWDALQALMYDAGFHCARYCKWIVPIWEVGKVFDGGHLEERNRCVRLVHQGAADAGFPERRIAMHERPLEGIPVSDFSGVPPEITGSALQMGFPNLLRGHLEGPGGHVYDGTLGFMEHNVARMRRKMPGHVVIAAEFAIPKVYQGQSWKPYTTFAEAQNIGRQFLAAGAVMDWNAGTSL